MPEDNRDELKKSLSLNDEWENYFSNTIIPQVFVDSKMVLRKFTPPAMKQFNLNADDVDKPLVDVVHNFRFPSLVENINHVIEHKEILEKEIQTTDLGWYQMNIIPYKRRQDNRVDGVIITFVDITSRINDMKEQERLIAENEMLFDTVVHDIKGPLGVLKMAAAELKKNQDTAHANFQTLLEILDTTVEKMVNFIDELAEKRKEEYENLSRSELLDLENILEDVTLSLRDQIHSTDARIRCEIEFSQVDFAKRELRSILFNLIQNSLKYKAPDRTPEILVKSTRKGDFTIISVSDNGMGIEEDLHEKIFKKYVRVNESVKGSGIGLHLVKQIVNKAGGKVELNSEPGKGTEVKIFIKTETG